VDEPGAFTKAMLSHHSLNGKKTYYKKMPYTPIQFTRNKKIQVYTIDPLNCEDIDDGVSFNIDSIGIHITYVGHHMVNYKLSNYCTLYPQICSNIHMLPEKYAKDDFSLVSGKWRNVISLYLKTDGNVAMCFNEINPIIGTTIVKYKMWENMEKEQLVKFLGSIGDAKYELELRTDVDIRPLQARLEHFSMTEQRLGVTPVSDWNTNNVLGYLMWEIISGTNTISGVSFEYGIEEGNLLKHLWKFENVCNEFIQACKKTGDNDIMIHLQEISQTIQNMYAPSDSIYIKLSSVGEAAATEAAAATEEDTANSGSPQYEENETIHPPEEQEETQAQA
jgi:hypothetical protein